jgi:hypothetical protein
MLLRLALAGPLQTGSKDAICWIRKVGRFLLLAIRFIGAHVKIAYT